MRRENLLILIVLSICLFAGLSFPEGQECSISVYTDRPFYTPDERIYIYGSVSELCENAVNADVAVEVTVPDGGKIFVDQKRTGPNRQFSTSFVAPLSMRSGIYTIFVSNKDTSGEKTFEFGVLQDDISVSTDRIDYVKGETVGISGMAIKDGAAWAGELLAILVKDDAGNIIYLAQPRTGPDGRFSEKFRVTPSMRTGEYRIYAAAENFTGESTFYVYPNVIINEVMFHPSGNNAKSEFIELYNPYARAVDMEGWTVRDNRGMTYYIPSENSVLLPASFAVITTDDTNVAISGGALHFTAGAQILGGLADSGGTISLFDENNSMVDSFTYRDSYGSDRDVSGAFDSSGEGSSLERIDPYGLTNYYANWDSSVGAATQGAHNSVYNGRENANISLLFADVPRYAMAQKDIEVNAKVKNNAFMYDLARLMCKTNGTATVSDSVLLAPLAYSEHTLGFVGEAGDFLVNVTAESVSSYGYADEAIITVFEPVMNGSVVAEQFSVQLLLPAIVPRDNAFQIIAVLTNEYDEPVSDVGVTLALPQAGGFVASGPLSKTVPVLLGDSADMSALYEVEALADTPDELLGKRTFSVYSEGTLLTEEVWDASFRALEIIGHSSPVLSLDLTARKSIDAGDVVRLFGAAFNTGTEAARDMILTIEADEGLEVVSEEAVVIEELLPSSFELYSFDVMAEDAGEYGIVLVLRDQAGNSYTLERTVLVAGAAAEVHDSLEFDGFSGSYGGSPAGGQDGAVVGVVQDAAGDDDVGAVGELPDEEPYRFEDDDAVDESRGEVQDFVREPDDKAPTGNFLVSQMVPRVAAAILAVLLIGFIVLNSKKARRD